MKSLNRRTFLRGLLGGAAVSVGLPPLEAMFNANGNAYAAGGAIPVRFGVWFWGNGVKTDRWTPSGQGEEWDLSHTLQAFAPFKDKISVVSGLQVRVRNIEAHYSSMYGMLSGVEPIAGNQSATWLAPSIDQLIADELGNDTRFRSLETGVIPTGISGNGPHNVNPAEADPVRLYQRLFGEGFRMPGEEGVVDPKLALRRSVLDAVGGQVQTLMGDLGATDRARLDQHLTGVRELELRLARLEEDPPQLAACVRPEEPAPIPLEQLSARNRVIQDLIIHALACDQVRVFTHEYVGALNDWVFPNTTAGHHQLTHDELGDQPQIQGIVEHIMDEGVSFLEAMDAIQEGDGTLLDHCAVLYGSEVSEGRAHSMDEMPLFYAGGACGRLKTGYHYRSDTRESTSKLMLTMMRGVGVNAPSFGEGDAQSSDTIGDLLV